jgi:hypothetical protein
MKTSEPKIDPKVLQCLVLARLLVQTKQPLSRDAVLESVARAISPPLSLSATEAAVKQALESCEQRGLVVYASSKSRVSTRPARRTPRSTSKRRPPVRRPSLSDKGHTATKAALGARSLPTIKTWGQAQQLVGLSLLRSGTVDKELHVQPLAALVLNAKHDVPASIQSLSDVVDYLAWRALGVKPTVKFTVENVQRHLLREIVPADVRVDQKIWRRMLAMRAVGAEGHDASALTRALLFVTPKTKGRSTADQSPKAKPTRQGSGSPARAARVENDNHPRAKAQPSLSDFAAAVQRAATGPAVARFHDDRAFIASVWEHMRGRRPIGDMPLAEFKQRLVAAHQRRLLRITRADLVGAMDPTEVERSEARYQDATFHFVALDAGGAR